MERPILFSTPMVQALIDGRKTQTRCIIKPQPEDGLWDDDKYPRGVDSSLKGWNGTVAATGESKQFKCPYGSPGDMLWVRETHLWDWEDYAERTKKYFIYKASTPDYQMASGENWLPSIHMPKDAARIWLRLTDIRVERLQDITEEDAKSEGVHENKCEDIASCPSLLCKEGCIGEGQYYRYSKPMNFDLDPCESAKESFKTLWESINGKESWGQNLFIWVVSFEVISTTGKPK